MEESSYKTENFTSMFFYFYIQLYVDFFFWKAGKKLKENRETHLRPILEFCA